MSVRLTTQEGVCAFFDSASGTAFGPVFPTAEEAEAFLTWMRDEHLCEDVRILVPEAIERFAQQFWNEHPDVIRA